MKLQSIRQTLYQHSLTAEKKFSQNFILNPSISDKISSFCNLSSDLVIEIGPGCGSLTRSLLQKTKSPVYAIEKDPRFVPILTELQGKYPSFQFINDDAFDVSENTIFNANNISENDGKSIHITGNLPFAIATQLLIHWFDQYHSKTGIFRNNRHVDYTLMFQKEVAEKLVADISVKQRSRLTVLTESFCKASIVYKVSRGCFFPKPKVDAAIVKISPLPDNLLQDIPWPYFKSLVAISFLHKRKTIRNNLKHLGDISEILQLVKIDPSRRPENIHTLEFIKLAKVMYSKNMNLLV